MRLSHRYPLLRHAGRWWPLFLPFLIYLPGLGAYPYPSENAPFSDLVVTHLPNLVYLRQSLLDYHQIPLWYATILSGTPFAANPVSGLWYPPGWLALLLPVPLGFNLLVLLHLLWGGVGMVALLRALGLTDRGAILGGVAFVSLPKLAAHYGAGHLTLMFAVPWTPWLLWAEMRRGIQGGRWRFIQPALVLAVIFYADVRWSVYAGLLWLFFSFAYSHNRNRLMPERAGPNKAVNISVRQRFGRPIGQGMLALLLTAPLSLPFLEYTRLSSRAALNPEESLIFSLSPTRLLGIAFPDFGGNHELILYAGGVVFVFAFLALLWKRTRNTASFWGWVLFASLLISLGSNIPFFSLLTGLPGLNLLRVPTRSLFIAGMALIILTVYAFDRVESGLTDREFRKMNLGMAAFVFFGLSFWVVARLASGVWLTNFIWGSGVAGLAWIGIHVREKIPHQIWFLGLLGLCILDSNVVGQSLISFRKAAEVESEKAALVQRIDRTAGPFRVYSPSYSLPQHMAANFGIELADGVDPLQLASYVGYMDRVTGVPRDGYSVTLPPFSKGSPEVDNAGYLPDPAGLGMLNIRYVVAEYDLAVEGLTLVDVIESTRIYRNEFVRPRAWLQTPGNETHPITSYAWSPNRVEVLTEGPGKLILAEVDYPGWDVEVDGIRTDKAIVAGILRAVELGGGIHQVVFTFKPLSIYLGLAVGLMTLIALVIYSQFWRGGKKYSIRSGE